METETSLQLSDCLHGKLFLASLYSHFTYCVVFVFGDARSNQKAYDNSS
jgi:hypothetical protein